MAEVRTFDTGATRDTDNGKLDYEGFLSPLALRRFAEYMNKNRIMLDGSIRASDNWQKGIPDEAYMKSMFRHFIDVWLNHRKHPAGEEIEEALCGLLFNVQGMLHERIKSKLCNVPRSGYTYFPVQEDNLSDREFTQSLYPRDWEKNKGVWS